MARGDVDGSKRSRVYLDAHGHETDDPAHAVSGELAKYAHGHLRRTRFFLQRAELPRLPVGEAAFLLWVLAALLVIWASIGMVLRFT
jgi:hypothetical protein